jgi:DNA-binding transcriptional regulator YiaG
MRINVFSQTKESRILVGVLWREDNKYCFRYNQPYTRLKSGISLGLELPKFNTGIMRSRELFSSLADRIPSRQNPEYAHYCLQWNISPDEQDQLVLLSTIGNRGPSSFLFRRAEDELIKGDDVRTFRKKFGLSIREFAAFIDIQPATLLRTEQGAFSSKMLLRLCEMLINVPSALDHQLHLRGQFLHDDKIAKIKGYLNLQRTQT